jgi:aldehyde dehydrogenase (NAD+)
MSQVAATIGGRSVNANSALAVLDPSTGQLLSEVADCGRAEVDQAVQAARHASKALRRVATAERARILRHIGHLIERDLDDLAKLECRQTGKLLKQARRDTEITSRYFDFYASAIETFSGSSIALNNKTVTYTLSEPHGVTAHVIPWNYPLQTRGRIIAPALAMGNCCVLKPAEEASLTALRVAELALEAGLPAGAPNVVVIGL